MTLLFERHIKKLVILGLVLFALMFLTSCRGAQWQQTPYTSWGDEFVITGFFSAIFGIPIAILSFPFAALLSFMGHLFGGSFFMGILLSTIIIRTVAWPVYTKQNNMTLKMQLMQPEMQSINQKYANRKDPDSQRRMQMEMQQMYKKYNINPLGCIGMMFIQMPIFMAMFEMLRRVNVPAEVYLPGGGQTVVAGRFAFESTSFLGFDLGASFSLFSPMQSFREQGAANAIFVIVVALLVFGVNFYQQRRSAKKVEERRRQSTKTYGGREQVAQSPQANQMKIMTMLMPIMFIPMAMQNAALGVYWLIGGIYTVIQHEIGRKATEKKLNELKNNNIR